VILHPADAEHAGVTHGQPVVVGSHRGELTGVAKVDAAIRRGAVSIPHGHHAANVNALTDKDAIDPVTGMMRYSGVPVTIRPPDRNALDHDDPGDAADERIVPRSG
jgi:anaerobic selenocysteine-containing dehydrogenase